MMMFCCCRWSKKRCLVLLLAVIVIFCVLVLDTAHQTRDRLVECSDTHSRKFLVDIVSSIIIIIMDLLSIEVKLRLLVVYYLSLQSILACILKIDWIIDFLWQLLISTLFAITLGKEQPLAHIQTTHCTCTIT